MEEKEQNSAQNETVENVAPAEEQTIETKEIKAKKSKKVEKVEEDLSNLSDDELYAKIQTQKLLNRKKRNKIATLIGLCFAFVLAVCLIVLAAVPVSLRPRCLDDGFASVAVYPGTTSSGVNFAEGSEGYNEFMKLYDKAFSQSYISAIFSGSLFSYEIEEKWDAVPTLASLTADNTWIDHLKYAENQVFTYQNGKTYNSNYYTNRWPSNELTFTDVYFEISKENGLQETTVYVIINNYPVFTTNEDTGELEMTSTKSNLIKVFVKANTNVLYDNWDDLQVLDA